MKMISMIEEWSSISIIIRLVMATLLGSLIGLERSSTKHTAGLRTFALVCLGSSVATMLNIYLAKSCGGTMDSSRISAQVVSGIGFLGAGTIIVTGHNQIKGLTTAASLWVTAIMGMAIGAGFVLCSVMCFLLVMTTILLFRRISRSAENRSRFIDIYIEVEKDMGAICLRNYIYDSGYGIIKMEKTEQSPLRTSDVVINLELDLYKKMMHQKIIQQMNVLKYVNYIEEL